MQRTTIGALAILAVGLLGLSTARVAEPYIEDFHGVSITDAAHSKGTMRIGIDNWAGYVPLCSTFQRQRMLADGWKEDCLMDDSNYVERFEKLRDGKLDFAVATVDTEILAGMRTDFPGVIAMVIDKSNGDDAILGLKDVVPDLSALRNRTDLKVSYTPDSPSSYLLKVAGAHFDVPLFRSPEKSWRVETNGSTDACKKLLAREVQVAICWEPDVSKALADPGIVKLLGTDQVQDTVVDVLLVNKEFYSRYPERVKTLLADYFKTLKHYQDAPDELRREVATVENVDDKTAAGIIKGVAWVNLTDNALNWFGVSSPGQTPSFDMIEIIDKTLGILKEVKDVPDNPLPGGDPRRIINSAEVAALFTEGVQSGAAEPASKNVSSLETLFAPLDEGQWNNLREMGTLKVRPILFQSGTDTLALDDKAQLDEVAETLKSYPTFRIEIQGHTKSGGDEEANKRLSKDRADAVARYLAVTYKIDPNRVRIVGDGSSVPLLQLPGEAYRAYRDRLARVEIHLKTEVY